MLAVSSFRRGYLMAINSQKHFSSVGFVGLGNMGGYMAKNMLKKGYKLTAYDINTKAVVSLVEAGANGAGTAGEAALDADIVISMLPSNEHVLDCYKSDKGILSSAKKGAFLIDSSTIDPAVAQQVGSDARTRGMRFLDAPVSGGVNAASAGTLTFMVGGSQSDFRFVEPILESMGSRAIHCGDIGTGQSTKLCNNMLLAISMIGTAEAFNLGERLGLDLKTLATVINSSTGRCWSSEFYNPAPGILENVPSSNNYKGGFGSSLMAKDLGLAQTAATRKQVPIPLGSLAHQIFRATIAQGLGNSDFSIVYQFLKGKQ